MKNRVNGFIQNYLGDNGFIELNVHGFTIRLQVNHAGYQNMTIFEVILQRIGLRYEASESEK